jgi:hypothetical protein
MSVSGQRICDLAVEAAEAADAEAALETLTRLRQELVEFERQQVARTLTAGRSYGDVARAMGISRQAAHRRFRDLAAQRGQGLPPTPEVRVVFDYARAEAKAVGASVLASVHILLAILRNGDRRAASALAATGVTLDGLRREARSLCGGGHATGADPHARPQPGEVDIRAVLAEAVRCARRDDATHVEVEHLLRSALSSGDAPAALALRRLGASRERVLAHLDGSSANGSRADGARQVAAPAR